MRTDRAQTGHRPFNVQWHALAVTYSLGLSSAPHFLIGCWESVSYGSIR